jgi:hypothetical protein
MWRAATAALLFLAHVAVGTRLIVSLSEYVPFHSQHSAVSLDAVAQRMNTSCLDVRLDVSSRLSASRRLPTDFCLLQVRASRTTVHCMVCISVAHDRDERARTHLRSPQCLRGITSIRQVNPAFPPHGSGTQRCLRGPLLRRLSRILEHQPGVRYVSVDRRFSGRLLSVDTTVDPEVAIEADDLTASSYVAGPTAAP